MKKYNNSTYPEDWRKTAQKDWKRMEIMLKEENEDGAAYFLQQSLEKYL
ncbi:MAG: HEPN domain-containing protein [Vallitaleaceae bacterium]|nr:HEPN domain-containing protein [Vallitaleaceae bacterium]